MRQVPEHATAPLGIVGDGRVARHFRHYFDLLGISQCTWSRRQPGASPAEALAPCRSVLLLIPDSAVVDFIEAWPPLRAKSLVHCSGTLVTPAAQCAHPLMTFGPDLYDLPTYRAIPFILDTAGTPFAELLPGLPNPSFTIPSALRPYYHALCVMAGNFSTLLWQKLFQELECRFGIPPSAAHPYLTRMAANLTANPGLALTGPLSRGETAAVAANLKALDGDRFQAVYEAFVRAYEHRS